jgi:hypothetical protein
MSVSGPSAPAADLPRKIRELAEFVGFGEDDARAVRRTAPLVLAHEEPITAALYEHFLQHPQAARFFLRDDGTPDIERIERRKHSLGRWLRESAEAALGTDTVYYFLGVGLSHSHRTWGRGGAVPADLMVGAMSLTQTGLTHLFEANMPAPEALAAAIAWNKLLMIQLSVLLIGYLLPRPESASGEPRQTSPQK